MSEKMLLCDRHGTHPWSGQVVCTGCGAVWHLNVDNPPTEDGSCTCGAKLSGEGGTARAICRDCYVTMKAQQSAGRS